MSEDNETITVNEDKFNGTATLFIEASTKELAKAAARQFWKDEYGSRPSRIVSENNDSYVDSQNHWIVMVSDHSSGSLKNSREYEF